MKGKFDIKNVKADTWARLIVLVIALANQVLAIFGKGQIAIAENDIYQLCSIVATVISAFAAMWKNNSFTQEAQVADDIMKDLKNNDSIDCRETETQTMKDKIEKTV